jgi:hypothetical protein
VLLISGEAGVGKTTLAAEAARAAFDDGACVLFGHCEEDLATPYRLFAEALRHYVTHAPEGKLLTHVDAHGSELTRLVPALASRLHQMGFNGLMPLEPIAMYLGALASVLRRFDEAETYFVEATEFGNRMSAQFSLARTNLSWGRMLTDRNAPGDAEKAQDLLSVAHSAAADNGYGNVERSANEALLNLARS